MPPRDYPTIALALGYILVTLLSYPVPTAGASSWIEYPADGFATMTHYEMPQNYIASCGCTGDSTHYPTAALNQMAFGSSTAYGPSCGRCFKLSLLNTFLSNPPFYPPTPKSLVVKVTDLCPLSTTGWCNATTSGPNSAEHDLNFDLSYPSPAIPDDFFPSNASFYGYTDFGVWNISYESVSCEPNWPGSRSAAALGSVSALGDGACCPANPTGDTSDTCPSFSDQSGIPPNTSTTSPSSGAGPSAGHLPSWLSLTIPVFLTYSVIVLFTL